MPVNEEVESMAIVESSGLRPVPICYIAISADVRHLLSYNSPAIVRYPHRPVNRLHARENANHMQLSSPTAPPRRPRNLALGLVEAMTARIRDGRMRAGDKLPTEAAIMGEFGVSRTVVREA